jgi:hypothetical protein
MIDSGNKVADGITQTERRLGTSQTAYERLARSIDPAYQAQTRLAAGTATLQEDEMPKLIKRLRVSRDLKSILAAATVVIASAFHSGAASAQISGFGGDGYTRAMWRGTDGSISLWKLDPALNVVGSHNYGPYAGWLPVALTVIGKLIVASTTVR